MTKTKKSIVQIMESWLTSRPLMKLFAFILAVLLWLYIKTELTKVGL